MIRRIQNWLLTVTSRQTVFDETVFDGKPRKLHVRHLCTVKQACKQEEEKIRGIKLLNVSPKDVIEFEYTTIF